MQCCNSGNIWHVWVIPLEEVEPGSPYFYYGISLTTRNTIVKCEECGIVHLDDNNPHLCMNALLVTET